MDQGVRNLEQIQETDTQSRVPRGTTIALVTLGGACIVFAALALGGKRGGDDPKKVDPLGDLVAQHAKGSQSQAAPRPTDLSPKDVTFPSILSDDSNPTTALAAVKMQGGLPIPESAPPMPPPATDKLPVVPLPAQNVLEATPIVTRPRDVLTQAASDVVSQSANAELAPAGKEGGYQLQVSSFRTQAEADSFATQLRARSHKAYVVEAHVPGRGTWFRVRIGPFPTQHAASVYRSGFEGREHVVPFIVPPQTK